MINVLVVDDQNLTHRLIETYLKSEPEIKIIGFANDGQEALEKVSKLAPDIVLMDVEMPKMNGLAATGILNQEFPKVKVLMLTVHDNEKHFSQAIQNGARGYLLKTTTAQELKNAIQYVYQGYFQLSVQLTEKYLYKLVNRKSSIVEKPQSEEVYELKRKVNYLYKSLSKLENYLTQAQINNLEQMVEEKIAVRLKEEIALLGDRDSHLQFKVDRMKHNQERLQQNISYLFKIQLACIVIAIISILYTTFTNLN